MDDEKSFDINDIILHSVKNSRNLGRKDRIIDDS